MSEIITSFFTKEYETQINNRLLDKNYTFQYEEVVSYIKELISCPIQNYLDWIDNNRFYSIGAIDMPQISSIDDVFFNIIYRLIECDDPGLRFVDLGKLIQNDGIERTDVAYRKYGENHSKTAEYFGFLFSINYYYYVSCFGYSLSYLSDDEKTKLLIRLIMRTNLFKSIYLQSQKGKFSLRTIFDFLSDKTYLRRISSTKQILSLLKKSNEYDFEKILNKMEY